MFRVIAAVGGIVLLNLPCAWAADGGDWPAWRGPRRDARSDETGLLSSWPEGGPKLLWKTEGLGEGYSTPSVAGNLIYKIYLAEIRTWIHGAKPDVGQGIKSLRTKFAMVLDGLRGKTP